MIRLNLKNNVKIGLSLILCLTMFACAKDSGKAIGKIHQPAELIEDANLALQMLKDGNERYLKGALIPKTSYSADREILKDGQKPFAVILTCSDSRAVPEIFFDQKLGDIFVIRNAGNIADTAVLGSIEYAVEHLKAKLVVVCGHSKCGAVTAACANEELPPNIQYIVDNIKPAVEGSDVDAAINKNVRLIVDKIKGNEIVKHEKAVVVGAYYDIHTGKVKWFE